MVFGRKVQRQYTPLPLGKYTAQRQPKLRAQKAGRGLFKEHEMVERLNATDGTVGRDA